MRSLAMMAGCTGLLLAAGCSVVVDNNLPDGADGGQCLEAEFCQGRDDGADCSTSELQDHICVDFCCVPEGCGNGFLEPDGDPPEECDDGNTRDGDGCDSDCTFTCELDADCDDGDPCDGRESCEDNVCQEGSLQPDGTPCTAGDGGLVGECQDGVCTSL